MDFLSTAIGFLVGVATGAGGAYFGDKYTDKRRRMEAASETDALWRDVTNKFPRVIEEMRTDVLNPVTPHVRTFFIKSSKSTVTSDEPHFEYHTDVHSDILQAVAHLEEVGLVEDITPGNCPKYKMTLAFVERLRA